MTDAAGSKLRFHSDSDDIPEGTLTVTRLTGHEEISRPYRFVLELVSSRQDIDPKEILRNRATVEASGWVRDPGQADRWVPRPVRWTGVLSSFQQMEKTPSFVRYRAVLVPRFRKLSLNHASRIFLDQTIMQIVAGILKEHGFSNEEFEDRTAAEYPTHEYVVQYEETDLDFIHRWLEHEGVFYFFEQTGKGEKIIFADSEAVYVPVDDPDTFRYNPVLAAEQERGIAPEQREPVVESFVGTWNEMPARLVLKEYNWRSPGTDLSVSREVSPEGFGTVYNYNNHYKTVEEGNALAQVRAEEILCRENVYEGAGNGMTMRAGRTMTLQNHYRDGFNRGYLLTRIQHEAEHQVPAGAASEAASFELRYRNTFTALPSNLVFRPRRETSWPSIHGVMNAKVDAAGSGQYAEVDEQGRYKVKLPFDRSDRSGGSASRFIRMAQPYSGSDHGMHFPLHKGSEVLLTFVDGNPDRPIITGTVPNPDNPSVVNSASQTVAGFRTAGGNLVELEDEDGHQRIHMSSGSGKSNLTLGSGSDDRAELNSEWSTVGSTLGGGVSSGLFTSFHAGGTITATTGRLFQALVWNLVKQQFPTKLALAVAGEVHGKSLQESHKGWPKAAAIGMQAADLLLSKLMKFIWGKFVVTNLLERGIHKYDYFPKKKINLDDCAAYLIRTKGMTRFELKGKKIGFGKLSVGTNENDMFIGTDLGNVDIYAGSNLHLYTGTGFYADVGGTMHIVSENGRLKTGWQTLELVQEYRRKGGPAVEGPKSTLAMDKDGLMLFHNPQAFPTAKYKDAEMVLKKETTVRADESVTIQAEADSVVPDPKKSMIEVKKDSITIDSSAVLTQKVEIKGPNSTTVTVQNGIIKATNGQGTVRIGQLGDVLIDAALEVSIKGSRIRLNSETQMIDCCGAQLMNCKNLM